MRFGNLGEIAGIEVLATGSVVPDVTAHPCGAVERCGVAIAQTLTLKRRGAKLGAYRGAFEGSAHHFQ